LNYSQAFEQLTNTKKGKRMQINFNSAASKNNYNFTGSNKTPNNVSSFINTDRMVDSFINMAKEDTGSNDHLAETQIPSSEGQKTFAKKLEELLKKMNLKDVEIDEHSIVTATLDSNIGDDAPVIGLLAHMDTSPDAPTKGVKPQIHDYKGGDIKLKENTIILADDLKDCIGKKIITSDGTTLLGTDDKAGIAEILETINVLKEHPELKHPKIRIAFTPDEETGMGINKFDIKRFGADVAYTVDGDLPAVMENESFNAFNPEVIIKGKNVHAGYAYKKMVNANTIANKFINKLPKNQTPETTKGRQGYFHVSDINGSVEETKINMLVRDFDLTKAQKRVEFLQNLAAEIEKKYPGCSIAVTPNERYRNMKESINELPEVVEYAKEGIKKTGLTPKTAAIRGGTDGARLSLKGLLTPNIGAGGRNFHSKTEFLPIEDMKQCTENIINILSVWAEKAPKIMPKILLRR
jgi:tripeptide aminopeptidase